MKALFLILCLISLPCLAAEEEEPMMMSHSYEVSNRTRGIASRFERDVKAGRLPVKLHKGLDTLLRIGAYKLRREGYGSYGKKMMKEWDEQYSGEYLSWAYGRQVKHIGDHPAVSKWLEEKMLMMSFFLGAEIMYNLRLSDIITFNSTPKTILFCADEVNEEEYRLHWVHDEEVKVRGLAPTVAFWVSEAACLGASLTSGFLFCAPICMGVEYLTRQFIAPKTNHWLWSKACHQGEE